LKFSMMRCASRAHQGLSGRINAKWVTPVRQARLR
jgi:hypothetical protein